MSATAALCLSLVLQGPPILTVPSQVVELAKKRIVEQFAKNQGVQIYFDANGCPNTTTFELRNEGLHIQHDGTVLDGDFDPSFQELLEGRKIHPPMAKLGANVESHWDATPQKTWSKKPLWFALGAAILGGAAYAYSKNSGSSPSPTRIRQSP